MAFQGHHFFANIRAQLSAKIELVKKNWIVSYVDGTVVGMVTSQLSNRRFHSRTLQPFTYSLRAVCFIRLNFPLTAKGKVSQGFRHAQNRGYDLVAGCRKERLR